jgi:hypothetical protein
MNVAKRLGGSAARIALASSVLTRKAFTPGHFVLLAAVPESYQCYERIGRNLSPPRERVEQTDCSDLETLLRLNSTSSPL